jgi:arylsulfatase A-like enzyme
MAENGILENTIFVFTSDHGELFERGIRGTSHQPFISRSPAPLLISGPAKSAGKTC